jgi:hypothetical protein
MELPTTALRGIGIAREKALREPAQLCEEESQGETVRNVRISVSTVGDSLVVKVAGALTHEGVAELESVIAPCEGALRLDLSELRSLDEEGLAALQALGEKGAEIVGASPYIALLIGPPSGVHGR